MPKVGSLRRRVTQFTIVYKKAEMTSILTFNECKVRRHMEKKRSMVPKKIDPCYSSRGLS
jgi:hypothetical protein